MTERKKKRKWQKALIIVGCIILVLVILALSYVAYAYIKFKRLGDMNLEIEKGSRVTEAGVVEVGKNYSIITSNLGFGAYSADFDFFMDGGHESWAFSKEAVHNNIGNMMDNITAPNPDFIFLQEIDRDSTRSYHIDELQLISEAVKDYNYTFAYNLYKSPYYVVPVYQPHGLISCGMAVFSKPEINEAVRKELPIMNSITKFFDLDRCYVVTKLKTDNGKYLCLYNIHLSAYGSDDSVREGQLNMLIEDMMSEYNQGNYIICGGDFNHELSLDEDEEPYSTWAYPFPRTKLPKELSFAMDILYDKKDLPPTGRDTSAPYVPGVNMTFLLDGFIISDNVEVVEYENMQIGFLYTDHEPVYMNFRLK